MKVIGLTGGIGTGKSTVSAYLKEKGCVILDADKMSRQLTAPGGAALPEIRKTFGMSNKYCKNCLHWSASDPPYGNCEYVTCCLFHGYDSCEKWEGAEE